MSRQRPPRREPLAPPPSASSAPATKPTGAWAPAAGGLHTYALGLTWRLILTVGGYVVLLFAIQARSPALAKFVGVIMPLLGIATGLVMLVGLIRFTRHPADSQARSSAMFAAAVFGIAFVLELIGMFLVLAIITGERVSEIRETAELAGKVGIWAIALAFAHLLALLVAFRSLSRRVGNQQLGRQAISVGVVVLLSAALVVSIKWWLPHAELDMGMALLLAITTLCVAIAAIGLYIRLVNVVADTLLAARESGLPESELLR